MGGFSALTGLPPLRGGLPHLQFASGSISGKSECSLRHFVCVRTAQIVRTSIILIFASPAFHGVFLWTTDEIASIPLAFLATNQTVMTAAHHN
jgi:hypothetical protein